MTTQLTDALELQARGGFPLHTFVPRRYRPGNLGTWSGHLAFANDLIVATRPNILVELGTHYGESYFGFCQTVQENRLPTTCYAVDTWIGEEHAGFYGEDVYQDVASYNESNYKSFSYLLRRTFNEALESFSQESIDLLHIDGLHTYEAVRHDFDTWFPKVRAGGIILLHDVMVRHADFGVWRLWEEIERDYPETFGFHHWWGLGVLRKPGGPEPEASFLDVCFQRNPEVRSGIQRQYSIYAFYLEHTLATPAKQEAVEPTSEPEPTKTHEPPLARQPFAQLYLPTNGIYSEEASKAHPLEAGTWNKVTFEECQLSGKVNLRIDPLDRVGIVEISSVAVKDGSGNTLWAAETPKDLHSLHLAHDLIFLPDPTRCQLLCYGNDPVIILPEIETTGSNIKVELQMQFNESLELLADIFRDFSGSLHDERVHHSRNIAELKTELKSQQAERMLLSAQLAQVSSERNDLRGEVRQTERFIEHLQVEHLKERESLRAAHGLTSTHANNLRAMLDSERAMNHSILQSKSWKLTEPLRKVMQRLGAKP